MLNQESTVRRATSLAIVDLVFALCALGNVGPTRAAPPPRWDVSSPLW
jgi:hypothetical protein